jgi:guanosine-3',5'-bis(diphosphate) 3'-pyrophosphohydrolase
MNTVERARIFAMAAHSAVGQTRKYTGEPYWTHTQAVADRVAQLADATEEQIAAAHLHDTLEDTAVTFDLIQSVVHSPDGLLDWSRNQPNR